MTEHDETLEHEDVEPELLPEREAMSTIPTDPHIVMPPDGWGLDDGGSKGDAGMVPTDPDGPPEEVAES